MCDPTSPSLEIIQLHKVEAFTAGHHQLVQLGTAWEHPVFSSREGTQELMIQAQK